MKFCLPDYRCILPVWLACVLFPGMVAAGPTTFSPAPNSFAPTVFPKGDPVSDKEPVLLAADHVDYLQQEELVIASGKVEVAQGKTLLLCDTLVYDRKQDVVKARGNVSVMDAVGNVIFADEMELHNELSSGVIAQFKARMTDDSLFASTRAVKVDENIVTLDNAVYSPCKVACTEPGEPTVDPLWQVRAKHVVIDQEKQTVVYDDAWMELYGLPVLYTPYLSHATPNADAQSGIMTPEFRRDRNLGNVYTLPVYYAIGGDRDMVITPIETSKEGWVLKTTYRQKFDKGQIQIDDSATNPRDRDSFGNALSGRQFRGHLYALGDFKEDEDTRWGFDYKHTTDDTYMRKYSIDPQTLLVSRAYGETFDFLPNDGRSALTGEVIGFQGLASTDDPDRIPLIFPLIGFGYTSDPNSYGARTSMESSMLVLQRNTGTESRRLANNFGWHLPYITDDGQMIEFNSQLRADIYNVNDVTLSNGQNFNGTTGRVVPEVSTLWRYPFINTFENASITVEPIVGAAISPSGGNPESLPNEDSVVPEFTDTNLFSTNRFSGYDRIEHGPRISYGLRGLVNHNQTYYDWLIGQHYRTQEDRNFPFSSDLTDNLSDYVGKMGVQVTPFYFAYRFRLDKQTLEQRRKELDVSYQGKRLRLNATYVLLYNDPILASREELAVAGNADLTKNIGFAAGVRKDLEIEQITSIGMELTLKNECANISGVVTREYTRDREVKPSTKYLFRFALKNLN